MIKSGIGAVFHVNQNLAEVILGVPPLQVHSQVNKVKHLLKLNIIDHKDDPLKNLIHEELNGDNCPHLHIAIKDIWQFLRMKLEETPECFSSRDKYIINNRQYNQFTCLSRRSCQYSKSMIVKFTEKLWQNRLDNQCRSDGFSVSPIAACQKIRIPTMSRKIETLVMGLFYENNLLNYFVSSHTSPPICKPRCPCHPNTKQDAMHILTECLLVTEYKRNQMKSILRDGDMSAENHILLLNFSRHSGFMELVVSIIKECVGFLRTEIKL